MRIAYEVTPARLLPEDVHVSIVEGPHSVVLQLSDAATLDEIAYALTLAVTDYAADSWLYVGTLDWSEAKR